MLNSKALLLVTLCIGIVSIAGLPGLSVTADNRILVSRDNDRATTLREFEDTFGHQNIVGFVVSCPDNQRECTTALPRIVREITQKALTITHAISASSLSNFPHLSSINDELIVSNYLDVYCDPSCPEAGRDAMDSSNSLIPFLNEQGNVMAVYVNLLFSVDQVSAVEQIYEDAQQLISSVRIPADADIKFVGRVPMMHAFIEATNSELTSYMGAAILLIFALVWLCFGNLKLALTVVGLGVASILSALGLAGWFNVTLSTASATLPTIIFTLTTATSMHYFMHVIRVISEDSSRDQKRIAFGAVGYQLAPTLITAGSTALAMLSMVFVDSPPFKVIGVWTAVSLAFCCLYLFIIVPPIVAKIPKISFSRWQNFVQPALNQHARYIGKNRYITIVGVLLCLVSTLAITRLDIDDDFVRFFGENTQFRQDTEFVSKVLIGPTNIEVVVDSTKFDGVNEPEFLNKLSRLAVDIRSHELIDSVSSILDVYEKVVPNLSDEISWRALNKEAIAQTLLLYELSLTAGQSNTQYVDSNKRLARLSLVAKDISSKQIIELEDELLRKGRSYFSSNSISITGEAIPLAHLSRDNIPSVAISVFATCLILSIMLGLYFKNARIGIALFCTTVVPVLCGFGLWSLFATEIGIAAVVTLAVCMGVVIDDSVHLVYRFSDASTRLGLGDFESASYAVHRVGSAMITTTLILSLGFGVLAFSSFQINRTFGSCTVLILISALLIDLLILPSLLPSKATDRDDVVHEQLPGENI